jgi:hypothetical protein
MTDVRYLLNVGRDNARTIGELAETLNLPRRVIEEAVQQARLERVPILSGSEGVWIAASAQEALEGAEALRRRAITQLVTARALRAAGRRMAAIRQPSLWDEAA